MSIISNIFEKSQKNKELIALRKYNDGNKFWCGYVLSFNESLVQIQHINKVGLYDGIVVELIENIENIDLDSYNLAMQYLIETNGEIYNQKSYELPQDDDNWQYKFLNSNSLKDAFITIGGTDDLNGFVRDFDEEYISMQIIGPSGEDDEITVFKISEIEYFQINDLDNRKREKLFYWRKENNL